MKFSNDQVKQLKQIIHDEVKSELKVQLKSGLAPIKHDIKSIKKDLNWVIGKYDTRLCSLEQHTSHPPQQIDFSLAI